MGTQSQNRRDERGTLLLVVVFIATAIAALATITSGRVIQEQRMQRVLEDEARAYNDAYAQIHMALNVVNTSAYNQQNQNLAIRDALAEPEEEEAPESWLADPADVEHGLIDGTNVRVYRGRDYIKRLQRLRGDEVDDVVDNAGASDKFFVLEGAGRAGDTTRLVSALVRETEPFSSFVFFQNRHALGVSGSPR